MRSKDFRTSSRFLRNEFEWTGQFNFARIHKQTINLDNVQLISISDTKPNDYSNSHKGVHHFTDDRRFASEFRLPERSLAKLAQYSFLCTPQFSCYNEMPMWKQIESTGKNRWIGAFWQSKGLKVIPSLCWSFSQSFDFCFDGIDRNGVVAVATLGCRHNRRAFMRGYDAMLERLSPSAILCLGTPFNEMRGRVIYVDYITSRRGGK